jgi:arginyl-tRNA synthetase
MEERVRNAISRALLALGGKDVSFTVERPTELSHGDYATNAALSAARVLQKSPRDIAEALVEALRNDLADDVAKVEVAGPGFVNITLSQAVIIRRLEEACAKKDAWGKSTVREGDRVMIEYGNPNPFKEMHIGHLVGAIIGESLSRVLEAQGAAVLRDTFGGDVGPHVAKALWALTKKGITDIGNVKEIGIAYIHGSKAYEESEEAKAEIDALNTKIYEVVEKQDDASALTMKDRELLALWRKGREVSMLEFERIFKVLGTKYDYIFYDSDTTAPGLRVVGDALAKGIFEKSDGAIIYKGEEKGLHTLVFVTSRGTPTYETKDVGLAFLKEERAGTDEVIIVTAVEQVGHFKVFLSALEDIAPHLAKKTKHIAHGLLSLTTGKMSSRKGNIITGAELINDVIEEAKKKNEDPLIAEQVAVGAVKYMILRQAPGGNIIFDPEKSLSLLGDSGPYLQYALVRARKILAYEGGKGGTELPPEPYALERVLIHYPEVVRRACTELSPQHIAQYLTEIAGMWNSFYASEQVLGSVEEAYKMRLVHAFATTMENGLRLLGMPAPERM